MQRCKHSIMQSCVERYLTLWLSMALTRTAFLRMVGLACTVLKELKRAGVKKIKYFNGTKWIKENVFNMVSIHYSALDRSRTNHSQLSPIEFYKHVILRAIGSNWHFVTFEYGFKMIKNVIYDNVGNIVRRIN